MLSDPNPNIFVSSDTWTAVGLLQGSHCSMSTMRVMDWWPALGTSDLRLVETHLGKQKFNEVARL